LGATGAGRAVIGAVALIALLTAAGLVALWPADAEAPLNEGLSTPTETADVVSVSAEACPPPQPGECGFAMVLLTSGPDEGSEVELALGGGAQSPELSPGDDIKVNRAEPVTRPGAGPAPQAPEAPVYSLADFERGSPMLWLAIAFAALVILFGRVRGALSLLGLALSLAIVLAFVVPAILDDRSPPLVALVGSLAVMLTTILLAHGWNAKSLAAILGTAISLVLVVVLALVFTDLAHLTGFSSDEAILLSAGGSSDLSFDGLLVAGMVIGALGVLDDVTVSQASTVLAVRAADSQQSLGTLYRRAIAVGRDHVSATVNTLVLAYVGASLPVLLLFSSGELGVLDAANTELVATEIIATLVGSIGLIAAVPVTTLLAAVLATRLPDATLREEAAAGHSH
jgi:uncharacterized membrane protein